jgi:hypothetical protein
MTAIFGIPDINIDNEITAYPIRGEVCSIGGLPEHDSNFRVREMNIDMGITGYLSFHKIGAYYGVDCGKMTAIPEGV